MPHQCVRCNTFYDDGSSIILSGCPCGGRLFFFVKKEKMEQAQRMAEKIKLTEKEKVQIEDDVYEILGQDADKDEPVVLDLEAIRVVSPGKYELDLVHLFKGEPMIFKLEEGKYMIDLIESFKTLGTKRMKKKA